MSVGAVVREAAWPRRYGPSAGTWQAPDTRRVLQLGLAAIWLLDAVLQYQGFMFTRAFGQMLARTAAGNPAVIAGPVTWAAGVIERHPEPANTAFATIQLLLGLGIAWRPTARIALAASVGWSVGVWWFGEGLGGVLAGTASPVSGAPGAVILYALLAVLLWPAGRAGPVPFEAARVVGARAARVLWLVLWGSLAYMAVQPAANRAPQALHDMISQMASGEPGWIASINNAAAGLLAHRGLEASIILAVLLAVAAGGIVLPAPAARAALVLAVVVAVVVWAAGEDFGAIFTGSGTDPNSGPLLVLLAAAYWPRTAPADVRPEAAGQAAAAHPSAGGAGAVPGGPGDPAGGR